MITQATTNRTLNQGSLPGNTYHKYLKSTKRWIAAKTTNKPASVNTSYLIPPTITIAPIIWAKLPSEYKLAGSLTAFKSKIKSWKCEICTCRLCKKYEPSLRYI